MAENNGFVVGAEVIFRTRGNLYTKRTKIARVYKNGNFLLEGEKQQYKPNACRAFDGTHYARKTGKPESHNAPTCMLATPEVLAKVEGEQQRNRLARDVREYMDQIKLLPIDAITEDNIGHLRMFVEALQAQTRNAVVPVGGHVRIG